MKYPPNFPVIVVHLDDGTGHTICTGSDMPSETNPQYQSTPRYFCVACQRSDITEDTEYPDKDVETVKNPRRRRLGITKDTE